VMPAYNAAKTLRRTYDEIPREVVDDVLLVDDHSADATVALSRERVRRARLGMELLARSGRDYPMSELGAAGLALPLPSP